MHRSGLTLGLLCLFFLGAVLPGFAAKRVALVVGNSKYEFAGALANPTNDARAMSASLRRLGFDVIEGFDTTIDDMAKVLDRFSESLQDAEVGLFFYAGHGLSFGGKNYIVPTNAKLESQFRLRSETIPIDDILSEMTATVPVSLVFLDACRNNPLADTLKRSLRKKSRAALVGRGLEPMQVGGQESLIVFATEAGAVAEDGTGHNSPFTTALLNNIEKPGVDIEVMLKTVQREVKTATKNSQRPERWSKLESDFQFNPDANASTKAKSPNSVAITNSGNDRNNDRREEQLYWESVKDIGDRDLLQSYVDRYPNGRFVGVARALVRKFDVATTDNSVRKPKPTNDNDLARQQLAAEKDAWLNALTQNTSSAFENYLFAYPQGIYSQAAKTRMSSLATVDTSRSPTPPVAPPRTSNPAFNCAKARKATEIAICAYAELGDLDVTMSDTFYRLKGRLNKAGAKQLAKNQGVWLRQRNACQSDQFCIQTVYQQRISQLQAWGG